MAFHSSLKGAALTAQNTPGYRHAYEHVFDELKRLDLLIRRQLVLKRVDRHPNQLDRFKGLVISDDEIDRVLSTPLCAGQPGALAAERMEELDTLDQELGAHEALLAALLADSFRQGIELPLCRIVDNFELSRFESTVLLICLAPEVDSRYETLYAYLHDDITRKHPSPGLVINLLADTPDEMMAARRVFAPDSPLFRHRLLAYAALASDDERSFLSRPLKIDERIAGFLLGSATPDSLTAACTSVSTDDSDTSLISLPLAEQQRLRQFAQMQAKRRQGQGTILYCYGPYGTGRKEMARVICNDLGISLLNVAVERLDCAEPVYREHVDRIVRESILQNAALCLDGFDSLLKAEGGMQRLQYLAGKVLSSPYPVFVIAAAPLRVVTVFRGAHFLSIEFPVPDLQQRKMFWEREGGKGLRVASGVDYGALAGRFNFSPGQIRDAVAAAEDLARWRHPESSQILEDDLYAASRDNSTSGLCEMARKITPKYGWHDLVLPEQQFGQLTELCSHSRYRHIVYGAWGFDRKLSYGKGLSALFTGPPGTGKTMAAEVIASDLRLDLYKIDLSQVVSKYIGETEKNLDRIFSEARTSNAILFFDEADALFGKRSEVKDAHDRYANIETGYLLQKMEEYEGIAILATNIRGNMDEAFVRRIQFIVEFPFPREPERLAIWQRIWPEATPLAEQLDLQLLAQRFEIAGGNIRNIALSAAFLAASAGGVVTMHHLMQATRREYQKIGKIINDGEF